MRNWIALNEDSAHWKDGTSLDSGFGWEFLMTHFLNCQPANSTQHGSVRNFSTFSRKLREGSPRRMMLTLHRLNIQKIKTLQNKLMSSFALTSVVGRFESWQ
jgi:hypothetical protein